MRGLAQRHSVRLLAVTLPSEDLAESLAATSTYCDEVIAVANPRFEIDGLAKRARQALLLPTPTSFDRWLFDLPAMHTALDQCLAPGQIDLVVAASAKMGYYYRARPATANRPWPGLWVLDEHNIEYDLAARLVAGERGLRRLFNYANYLKLRREEQRMWQRFAGCAVTSERDEQLIRRDSPMTPTAVVPNAVDGAYFTVDRERAEPTTIAFFGANHYYPNSDAIAYFIEEIWPLVRQRQPRVKFRIIGYSPESLYRYASDDISLTGPVDDIRTELARASIIVVPLRFGGGTRFKIVEAMAMGKAVVSTTIGAEGLAVTHQRDILLADQPDQFAAQLNRLLDHPQEIEQLGNAARQLVERRYDWSTAVDNLERFFDTLTQRRQ